MSKKIENALVSELSWRRDSDGHWKFSQYCDDILRIWNRSLDGYIEVSYDGRMEEDCIKGYCIKGQEDKWKTKMLEIAINFHKKDIKKLTDIIIGLEELKSKLS